MMMAPKPRISVVIPAYQEAETIDRCLAALAGQTAPAEQFEVIVVDDGSTDGTAERVQAHPGVCLLVQERAGPAAARNRGMDRARGEIVLFTDADCEPAPDWIERMAAPFDDPQVDGVKGAYRTRQRELVARFVQAEYEDKYDQMAGRATIDFVDTYAAGYRRAVLVASGGFDPAFPSASVEDQELSFRLARQGHRLVFAPQACVYHWGHPRTAWAYARRKFRIGYWKVLVARRHPQKLWRDSHTPPALRLQVGLAGAALAFLIACPFWPVLGCGAALAGLLFLLSTLPFAAKAWRKDRRVAIASPALLLLRALALGSGFAAGMAAHARPLARASS